MNHHQGDGGCIGKGCQGGGQTRAAEAGMLTQPLTSSEGSPPKKGILFEKTEDQARLDCGGPYILYALGLHFGISGFHRFRRLGNHTQSQPPHSSFTPTIECVKDAYSLPRITLGGGQVREFLAMRYKWTSPGGFRYILCFPKEGAARDGTAAFSSFSCFEHGHSVCFTMVHLMTVILKTFRR